MQKAKRLLAIEKIITEENISSHEVLLKKLKGKGIICTQATLSRNLRQLGAGRIPDGKGGYKYSLPESMNKSQAANRQAAGASCNNRILLMQKDFWLSGHFPEMQTILQYLLITHRGMR